MTDFRQFTHPNLGNSITLRQEGNVVALAFECSSQDKATAFADAVLAQLKAGTLNLTMMALGPATVTEHD